MADPRLSPKEIYHMILVMHLRLVEPEAPRLNWHRYWVFGAFRLLGPAGEPVPRRWAARTPLLDLKRSYR